MYWYMSAAAGRNDVVVDTCIWWDSGVDIYICLCVCGVCCCCCVSQLGRCGNDDVVNPQMACSAVFMTHVGGALALWGVCVFVCV